MLPRWELHGLGDRVLEFLARPAGEKAQMREAARLRAIQEFGSEQERKQLQSILDRLIPKSS